MWTSEILLRSIYLYLYVYLFLSFSIHLSHLLALSIFLSLLPPFSLSLSLSISSPVTLYLHNHLSPFLYFCLSLSLLSTFLPTYKSTSFSISYFDFQSTWIHVIRQMEQTDLISIPSMLYVSEIAISLSPILHQSNKLILLVSQLFTCFASLHALSR